MIASGIDPGPSTGAVAVVDTAHTPARAVACACWDRVTVARRAVPRIRLWRAVEGVVHTLAPELCGEHHGEVALLYALDGLAVGAAAVEGVVPMHAIPRTQLIALAGCAEAVAALLRARGLDVWRPPASEWRPLVGVPVNDARVAALTARAMVGDRNPVRVPVRVTGLPPDLATSDHLADACLLAELAGRRAIRAARLPTHRPGARHV